jgi:hypothetical protein
MVSSTASFRLRWDKLEYHLLLSKDLKFLAPTDHQRLHAQVEEVKRMLASLTRKVDSERAQFRG